MSINIYIPYDAGNTQDLMRQQVIAQALFKDATGYVEIRELADYSNGNRTHFIKPDQIAEYKPPIEKNVYFGVYDRQENNGTATGCISTGALWADYDGLPLHDVKARIASIGLPGPSIIVNSGHGYHCYWLLTERTTKDVTSILRAIAGKTGADVKATDRARIMRLPGTMNVKGEPVPCQVIEATCERYSLNLFEAILGVQATELMESIVSTTEKPTPLGIEADRPCIEAILKGVPEGERNFALGRLTKWLQLKGYTRKQAEQTILKWNRLNSPPENKTKLLKDFNMYWHGEYKLLGCAIDKPELQQVLYKYCNRPECRFSMAIGEIKAENSVEVNNRLLNNLHELTGNDIIIYGVLLRHREGLTTSLLMDKLTAKATKTPCISRPTMFKSIDTLRKKGFITVTPGNRRAGKENLYKAKPQGTYGLGYTLVSNGAINGAIDGRVTAGELRLYVLLLKYAYRKGNCYPSLSTLAKELRVKPQSVSIQLKALEQADYIKRSYRLFNGTEKLFIKLLV